MSIVRTGFLGVARSHSEELLTRSAEQHLASDHTDMQERHFAEWLARDYRTATGSIMHRYARASRLSTCKRIEHFLGDLDQAYDTDRMESLISRLEMSRSESMPRHGIPIDGNVYDGTANLKSAARLYQKFRASTAAATATAQKQTEQAL